MNYTGKNRNIHFGFWFECFLLTVVPLIFYILFRFLFAKFYPYRGTLNEISARVLGAGLGSVFHGGCMVCGVFEESFEVVKKRVYLFFRNAEISLKVAIKEYLYDLETDGADFWAYMLIVVFYASVAIFGIRDFLVYTGAIV